MRALVVSLFHQGPYHHHHHHHHEKSECKCETTALFLKGLLGQK